MAFRNRAPKSKAKSPRSGGATGAFSLGIQQLALRRPRTAQYETLTTPRSVKESSKAVKLPACRPTSGIISNRGNSKQLTRPIQQIDVEEDDDDDDDEEEDDEDEEEDFIFTGCSINRPVTAPVGCGVGAWTRMFQCASQRDEFEVPNLEDLRLEIPDDISKAWEDIAEENEEIRILLMGKRNSGKTATANTILGYSAFNNNSHDTQTKNCRYGTCQRFDRRLVVVDTPDVCNHGNQAELLKAIALTSPGPHVFIFVVGVGIINKTDEETYSNWIKMFGSEVHQHMIILFTRKDDLIFEGMTIFGYVNEVPEKIKDALTACNRRYVAFDNDCTGRESEVQVRKLLDMIDNILILNRGHYTNQVFEQVENVLEKRSQAIVKTCQDRYKEKVKNTENDLTKQCENEIAPPCDVFLNEVDTGNSIERIFRDIHSKSLDKNETKISNSSKQRPKSSNHQRGNTKKKFKLQRVRKRTARTPSLSPIESVDCDSESELIDVGNVDVTVSSRCERKLREMKAELDRETEKQQVREKIRMELEHDVDEMYRLLKTVELPIAMEIKTWNKMQ